MMIRLMLASQSESLKPQKVFWTLSLNLLHVLKISASWKRTQTVRTPPPTPRPAAGAGTTYKLLSAADSPEEQVITGQVPLTVIKHQHPEVTGGAPQLVTWPVDKESITVGLKGRSYRRWALRFPPLGGGCSHAAPDGAPAEENRTAPGGRIWIYSVICFLFLDG